MVADGTGMAVTYAKQVVVDLWFIESKWRKGTLDYREGAFGCKRYVLDAKGNVIPGKAQISSRNRSSRNDSWYFTVHAKWFFTYRSYFKTGNELAEKAS
jgi:ABC-type tungstate transport system permease subunit